MLNLVGLYHDSVLRRALESRTARLPPSASTTQDNDLNLFNRYMRYWWSDSPTYKKLALMITVAQYTQVAMEMIVLRRGGNRARWRIILFMEMLK